nr:methionine ABC transporter permease [uncultured Oscillibacter sp.]
MSEIFTAAFWAEYGAILAEGVGDTLVMVVASTFFAYLIGLPMGVVSVLTQPHGIRPHRGVNAVLGWIINIGRSFPFAILMVALFPFTKLVMGTRLGLRGAVLPLVVASAPFVARMVETSLSEVDAGVIEAARSMGASTLQTVWKVYLPEAMPSLILGGSITLIAIVGYTAIAGMVGAGGLGDLAIRYGHQRNVPSVMWVTVIILIILVQVVQSVFSRLSVHIDKRLK